MNKHFEIVKDIFNSIANTNSRTEKESIIKANQDNKTFRYCLNFLLNNSITTGISAKKLSKEIKLTSYSHVSFKPVMEYLKINNTGRDCDVLVVKDFIEWQPKDMQDFYIGMITKSLKLGIDAKTVNKVITNLIPTFDVQLGTSIDHCKIPEGTRFSISHKLNGSRCIKLENKLYTRSGKEYVGCNHIIDDINNIFSSDYVIDGELVYRNTEGLTDSEAFQKGVGIANSKAESKPELMLVIFDIIPVNEFNNGISTDTYLTRKSKLLKFKKLLDKAENLRLVDIFYEGTDQSEIWRWLDNAEDMGYEGIMINLDSPYECKRTKNLIKVKKFFTYDLKVTGYEEGTGRNKNKLGALIVEFKDNTVKVGSGFSDTDRKNLWNNRENLCGKLIEVKYKEITKDKKTNKESLQFPVFCGFRDDKRDVSYE